MHMDIFAPIYDFLRNLVLKTREETGIPISLLCSSSAVSSRTYAKLVKKITVKPECYVRLVIGMCRVCSPEEFMSFWQKLGERIYEEYGV